MRRQTPARDIDVLLGAANSFVKSGKESLAINERAETVAGPWRRAVGTPARLGRRPDGLLRLELAR